MDYHRVNVVYVKSPETTYATRKDVIGRIGHTVTLNRFDTRHCLTVLVP